MKRLALIVLAVAACHSDSVVGITAGYLTPGVWGGTNSEIDASSTSTSISIGCQSGTFPGNVPVDNQGKFSVNGSWNLSVGPVFLNGNMPAQATGQVSGSSASFAVAVY